MEVAAGRLGRPRYTPPQLDAKIVSSLKTILQNSNLKRRVYPEQQKAQKDNRFLRGRQIFLMIYEHFRVTGTHEGILDHSDLFRMSLHGDNGQGFDTTRDAVLLPIHEAHSDDVLESL